MSKGETELLGLLLGMTGLVMLLYAAGNDCWRQGAKDPFASVDLSSRCRGLWGECVHDNLAGLRTCDVTLSYLGHVPVEILAMRIVLVVVCVLSVVSILIMIPGLSCTRCTSLNPCSTDPGRQLWVSGALSLCGGVCGAIGMVWYGVDTYAKYRLEVTFGMPGITYEFGLSYWLALGAVLCCLASGTTILLIRNVSHSSDVIRMHLAPHCPQSHLGLKHITVSPQPTSQNKTYV